MHASESDANVLAGNGLDWLLFSILDIILKLGFQNLPPSLSPPQQTPAASAKVGEFCGWHHIQDRSLGN